VTAGHGDGLRKWLGICKRDLRAPLFATLRTAPVSLADGDFNVFTKVQ
jgi:hypothetical protein